jgi:hypothetical protein
VLLFRNSLTAGMGLDPRRCLSFNNSGAVPRSGLPGCKCWLSGEKLLLQVETRMNWVLNQDVAIFRVGTREPKWWIEEFLWKNSKKFTGSVSIQFITKNRQKIIQQECKSHRMGKEYALGFKTFFLSLLKKWCLSDFLTWRRWWKPDPTGGIRPTAEG